MLPIPARRRAVSALSLLSLIPLACAPTQAQAPAKYPYGIVVSPSGNSLPTSEQQRFYYQWAQRAGMNIVEHEWMPVTDGYLEWSSTQTGPDTYYWKAYDGAVNDAEAAGMETMLEVALWYRVPEFLSDKHPDMLMQTPLGGGDKLSVVKRDAQNDTTTVGSLASPELRKASVEFVKTMAARYKDRKGVRGYIIGEERGLPGIWPAGNYYGIDFSPAMRDAYHAHLRKKYKNIGALNAAWNAKGRYKDFKEIVWKRGWAYEPDKYRGEWVEFYKVLQQEFAEYHNQVARAIREVDPDAKIMMSDFAPVVNRVGHGSYPPLYTGIDEIAYKSYWNDQRMQNDFLHGITGGKDVWVSNFSEGATTQGTVHRYMEPRYVKRAFWQGFSRGLAGVFFWIWTPTQPEKMSLFQKLDDDSVEPIAATQAIQQLGEFMQEQWPTLAPFKPAPAKVVVHDPNLTFIEQQWQYADPKPERAKWANPTPAADHYYTMMDILARNNHRFTMSADENVKQVLATPGLEVLTLTGCDYLDDETLKLVTNWIESGKSVIIDDTTARFAPLGAVRDALAKYKSRPNVLTINGINWHNDVAQKQRGADFLNAKLPSNAKVTATTPGTGADVSMLQAPNGDELAIVVRSGPSGRPIDKLGIDIKWNRAHQKFTVLDPYAVRSQQKKLLEVAAGESSSLSLEGYQDAVLVLAQ